MMTMSDTTGTIDYQCQCAPCQSSRAIEVLRSMPELTDDGRAALHTISDALNTLEEDAFARWDAMNDVATAVGLDWQTATRDGILGRIKSALARVAELEAEATRLRQELEVQQGRAKTLLNRNSAQAARMRALLARAEAAEAERDSANIEVALEQANAREAWGRVAELETKLAAQEWRPVTITEPSQNTAVELLVVGYRGHDGYWHYPGGAEGLLIRGWRPVPPSVALREPTP